MSEPSDQVQFGSVTVYRPGGPQPNDTKATRWARQLVMDLKYSKPERIQRFASWMATQGRELFPTWFGPRVILVPAPGHALRREGEHQRSSTREIARALAGAGLGRMEDLLHRTSKVVKAAWSPSEPRTVKRHYDNIECSAMPFLELGPLDRVTIVDDVIASGATLFACIQHLAEALPDAEVAAFAVVRTMNLPYS